MLNRLAAPGSSALQAVERRTGVTLGGLVALALAILGWLLANAIGGRALYLIAYGLVLLIAVAVLLARRRRPVEAIRSQLPRRAREGQRLRCELTLTSDAHVSTFVVEESLHPHLGTTVRLPVVSLSSGQELRHVYEIRPRLRGVYRVGPLVAEFKDPAGLARRRQVLAEPVDMIVHPSTETVLDRPLTRQFEEPPLRPPISKPWPEGFEFYGMRDYVAGDDMRRVVWRAFARTERLLVREFEQGISDRVTVVLDNDRGWHSPGEPSDTFETAVRAAASVGATHLKDGMSLSLIANDAELGAHFRGARARIDYLDKLAAVKLCAEPLHHGMERMIRGGRRDSHVVCITSHFDARSAALAAMLVNAGASVSVVALVWDEADPASVHRAREVGAQVVRVKPGSALAPVFRAALQTSVAK
jgi:uncharacterized protein (DUF58 family)